MSFYKEVPGRKTTLESTLKFDTTPTAGSTNPVTSEGVKDAIDGAVGDASEALQEQIDDIAEKAGSGYIPKGEATVATLNGLSGQENGWLYTLTDAGTLTDGTIAVVAGDTVAWDATNSVWYRAMDYAPAQYGTNEVHNLATSITVFRTGDVIPVDGPSGTAKMGKNDLLKVTAALPLSKVDELKSNTFPYMDFTNATVRYIQANGTWGGKGEHNHICVPVTNQTKFVIKANATKSSYFAFLKTYEKSTVESDSPGSADFCTGYSGELQMAPGAFGIFDIPADAGWVYVRVDSNGEDRRPQYSYIANQENVVWRLQNLESDTEELKKVTEFLDGIGKGEGATTVSYAQINRIDLMPFNFVDGHKYVISVSFNREDFESYFSIRSGTMGNSSRLSSDFGFGTENRSVEIEIEWNNATILGWHVAKVGATDPVAGETVNCTAYVYDVTETKELSSIVPRVFELEGLIGSADSRLNEVEEKVFGLIENNVDLSQYTPVIRQIYVSGGVASWANRSKCNHICVPITGDVDKVRIKPPVEHTAIFSFLASYDEDDVASANPPAPDFATGYSGVITLAKNTDAVSVDIPSDANWLYIEVDDGFSYERYPQEVGIYKEESNLEARVEKLENNPGVYDFIGLNSLTTICHRGNCGVANVPENSVHSITNAAMQGQKFVECDVKKTADDEYVIMHDNTINRTMVMADGSAIVGDVSVASKTLSELETDYKYKTTITKYATKITTFGEWIARVKELQLVPMLHNLPVSLVEEVIETVGENFIYMGNLAGCRAVRALSKKCFIMYQYATQEDANHAIADADVPAVIADMLAIGGCVGYSSMYAATFSDTFLTALKKNGFYFQYSTQAPQQSSEFIAKGALFVLTNNWSNEKLSYRRVWRMADDLSNIAHLHEEDGCLKILSGESVDVEIQHNTNIKASLVIDGSVSVSVGGYSVSMSSSGFAAMLFGMNGLPGTSTITITAAADTLIRDMDIATN